MHIGALEVGPTISRPIPAHLAAKDLRTHIRVPGGIFAVTIDSVNTGELVYAAVNAAPNDVNGLVLRRWKVPRVSGTYRATLWRQPDRVEKKPESFESYRAATKLTRISSFDFSIV